MIRALLLLVLFAWPALAHEPELEDLGGPLDSPVEQLLEAVNHARALRGLGPVRLDDRLVAAAQIKSEDAAAHNSFSHSDSEGRGMAQRVQEAGYLYARLYENLAAGVRNPRRVTQLWLDSPGHRAAMTDAEVVHAGIGYAYGPITLNEGIAFHLWTLILAAPGPGGPFTPHPPVSDKAEATPPAPSVPPG